MINFYWLPSIVFRIEPDQIWMGFHSGFCRAGSELVLFNPYLSRPTQKFHQIRICIHTLPKNIQRWLESVQIQFATRLDSSNRVTMPAYTRTHTHNWSHIQRIVIITEFTRTVLIPYLEEKINYTCHRVCTHTFIIAAIFRWLVGSLLTLLVQIRWQ